MSAVIHLLAGDRLHCQHGPIDLIIKADGPPREVSRAYAAVAEVFPGILPGLCAELEMLRRQIDELSGRARAPTCHPGQARRSAHICHPGQGGDPWAPTRAGTQRAWQGGLPHAALGPGSGCGIGVTRNQQCHRPHPVRDDKRNASPCHPGETGRSGAHDGMTSGDERRAFMSPTAQLMAAAVWPYRAAFITPMAAVAGAVAEAVLAAMTAAARLERAIVNNGGDIAFHLAAGQSLTAGMVADITAPAIDAEIRITSEHPVRGIATSGWRGRSQSLGIADAVTVLARTAAEADAAATMIANAVDIDDPAIQRRPARQIKIASDRGDRLVSVDVGPLSPRQRDAALAAGQKYAEALVLNGRIAAACISLQGETRVTGAIERARLAR